MRKRGTYGHAYRHPRGDNSGSKIYATRTIPNGRGVKPGINYNVNDDGRLSSQPDLLVLYGLPNVTRRIVLTDELYDEYQRDSAGCSRKY